MEQALYVSNVLLWLAVLALAALAVVWAKWRFAPLRLPVVALVPWVLVRAWMRGWDRAQRIATSGSGSG